MNEHTVPAAGEAAPTELQSLSFADLFALHDALSLVSGVLCGLVSQPRFMNGRSEAGKLLDKFLEEVNGKIDAVYSEAESRAAPADEDDNKNRFGLLAQRYIDGLVQPTYALAHLAQLSIARES